MIDLKYKLHRFTLILSFRVGQLVWDWQNSHANSFLLKKLITIWLLVVVLYIFEQLGNWNLRDSALLLLIYLNLWKEFYATHFFTHLTELVNLDFNLCLVSSAKQILLRSRYRDELTSSVLQFALILPKIHIAFRTD